MADPNLAYGDLPGSPRGSSSNTNNNGGGGTSGRKDSGSGGFIGGTFSRWKKSEAMGSFASKVSDVADKVGQQLDRKLSPKRQDGSWEPLGGQHRFDSYASPRMGNDVKWYVDGAGYMWAVSIALERARESIWILDWWLSPELYLRRPPSKNEQYRLDRMLQAAAHRGVKVNVIVYKEVTQALTRKYLTPTLPAYLHSLLPARTDAFTTALTGLGLAATFASLEAVERESPLIEPPLPVSSEHTKHALEALHSNIAVFRHPDHLPDAKVFSSSFLSSLKKTTMTAATAASLPGDALRAIYGMSEDAILYWAHHEKLCIVDGTTAFMGGLDLCYGRWDLNQHPIADAHPEDLEAIVFPGQDYNNARIMDFADVKNWEQNKLDRKDSSRMGWSDVSIGLHGPVVDDLRDHFIFRWNFIHKEKYFSRKDVRYQPIGDLPLSPPASAAPGQGSPPVQSPQQTSPHAQFAQQGTFVPPSQGSQPLQSYNPQQQGSSAQQQSYFPQQQSSSQQQQSYPPPQQYHPQSPSGSQPQGSGSPYAHQTEHYMHEQPQYQPYHPAPQSSSSNAPPTAQTGQGQNVPYFPPPPSTHRASGDAVEHQRGISSSPPQKHPSHFERLEQRGEHLAERLEHKFEEKLHISGTSYLHGSHGRPAGRMSCQVVRSATKWSNGTPLEHSIQNAYAKIISQSQHFIYIENQFFITATGEKQGAVKNTIGQAIVERIIRAARNGQKFKVIVIMPAIPAFAGDLKDDSSLGTRAIMEFQYNSINRGGHSIMEAIANAGFDPMEYIRFYNLRSYDRINDGSAMMQVEQQSGVDYEVARREHDDMVDSAGYRAQGGAGQSGDSYQHEHYLAYQKVLNQRPQQGAARNRWDSVSACYMLNGPDIRSLPWADGDKREIDCFVSEELYVHSKVLIADDRIAICGSANLNDRSQLGYHDSEIACIIEDTEEIDSYMNRHPWKATKFAATLRRFLFRKHLGLVPPQDLERPDHNFEPPGVPNTYDYDSPEDRLVTDPLADQFLGYWNQRARTNTQAFGRLFHPVPHDDVRSWDDYNKFYEVFFHQSDVDAEGKPVKVKPKYEWGHVVARNFSGIQEVREVLSTIKGTLVEMPLMFLIKEDVAKTGLSLNVLTEELYT